MMPVKHTKQVRLTKTFRAGTARQPGRHHQAGPTAAAKKNQADREQECSEATASSENVAPKDTEKANQNSKLIQHTFADVAHAIAVLNGGRERRCAARGETVRETHIHRKFEQPEARGETVRRTHPHQF